MTLSVKDYLNRPRDSIWERELANRLRQATEKERLEFLSDFAEVNPAIALLLARQSLTKNESFKVLLDQGLNRADASSIRSWLEAIVPRLGFRKVLRHLRHSFTFNPSGVANASYWLPSLAGTQSLNRDDLEELALLQRDVRDLSLPHREANHFFLADREDD